MGIKNFLKNKKKHSNEIDPDEIFLDSSNMPKFNRDYLEGTIEKSIIKRVGYAVGIAAILMFLSFGIKLWALEINNSEKYVKRSENNRLRHATIFAQRGKILDRNGVVLASNEGTPDPVLGFQYRKYSNVLGIGNLVGFVKYPKIDKAGYYYETEIRGIDGIEKIYNVDLSGTDGLKIVEVNAFNKIQSEGLYQEVRNGKDIKLSIDTKLSSALYEFIEQTADARGFSGGAAVIMDVRTGELIALTSFPEYDPQILTDGKNITALANYDKDPRKPYLDRVVNGLYAPGSIIKPFDAVAVLSEKIIDPKKTIVSTGSISIPNEYDPTKNSVFNDWKAHGAVDMRKAIAVSSDVYFYEVIGGYQDQIGLGIARLEKYLRVFGFGTPVDNSYLNGEAGTIPNPDWKAINFPEDPWRVGDTYNTAIGQYGVQVTPIQVVKALSAIANSGKLVEPTIIFQDGSTPIKFTQTGIPVEYFQVVKEGMRQGVTDGIATGLNIPQVKIAAKTGTAQVGISKKSVNSWITGFFPYDNPKYVFALIMEKGPSENTIGALYVMRQFLDWASINASQLLDN